jgi:hypothetical protein
MNRNLIFLIFILLSSFLEAKAKCPFGYGDNNDEKTAG